MKILCIYHGNCQDGFGAAWAVRHALGEENVEFYPGVYQEQPPNVAFRDVIMVDFSYKRPVLEQIVAGCNTLLVLDHHQSAAEDLEFMPRVSWPYEEHRRRGVGDPKYGAIFDMDRSGAGLAWDYFHFHSDRRPPVIDHIEDRDLWRFKLPKTREIAAALFSLPYDFALWDRIMSGEYPIHDLFTAGDAIERKHHQDIANLLPVVERKMIIGGIQMPVANLPLTLTSDAGHHMASESGVGVAACYWDTPEGRVFSLRSTDIGPDVQKIAVGYGGGGHVRAAGFRMPRGWEGDAAATPASNETEGTPSG